MTVRVGVIGTGMIGQDHIRRITEVITGGAVVAVNDVDEAISFYCQQLGFTEVMHPAPTFAMLSLGDLRLVLSAAGRQRGLREPEHARERTPRVQGVEEQAE